MSVLNVARRAGASKIYLNRVTSSQISRSYASPVPALELNAQKKEKDPQLGDYPQLPDISRQYLPAKGWWDNQTRVNYGDTLHEKEELYSMWGPDVPVVPPRTALFHFSLAVLTFVAIGFGINAIVPENPAIPRRYPFSGLVEELGGLEENKANPESEEDEDS